MWENKGINEKCCRIFLPINCCYRDHYSNECCNCCNKYIYRNSSCPTTTIPLGKCSYRPNNHKQGVEPWPLTIYGNASITVARKSVSIG